MKDTKVVIALLAGLAAGTALGMLFAPKEGSETRDKLSESLANLGRAIKSAASEQIDNLSAVFKEKASKSVKETTSVPPDEEQAENAGHA
jgi:gas vesicle protein